MQCDGENVLHGGEGGVEIEVEMVTPMRCVCRAEQVTVGGFEKSKVPSFFGLSNCNYKTFCTKAGGKRGMAPDLMTPQVEPHC